MIYILLIWFIGISITGLVQRKLFAPDTLFSLIWTLILVAYLSYDGYYELTEFAAFLLILGSLGFLFGTRVMIKNSSERLPLGKNNPVVLRSKLFVFLSILSIVALAGKAVVNVQFLMLGLNFNDITNINIGHPVKDRGFFVTVITMLVAGPFTYVVIPILGLELGQPKKRIWVILVSLLIIALSILQSGRRSMLIYVIPAVLFLVLKKPKNTISQLARRKLLLVISSLLVIMIYTISWLSFQRDTSFMDTGYVYLGGGIAGFAERIELIDTWYFGAATLHGLLVPIMIGIKYLTNSYPLWWVNLDVLVEAANEIQIGPSEYMNAFTTMFYVPYIDFGVLGVLFISIIVGIIYGKSYSRVVFNPNCVNRSVYSLLIVGLFGSMYTLYFTQSPYLLSFAYVYFLFKR